MDRTIEQHPADVIRPDIAPVATGVSPCPSPELAGALDDLLGHYVDLVESDEHGAYSLKDEQVIGAARAALSRSGCIGRRPGTIGNDITRSIRRR